MAFGITAFAEAPFAAAGAASITAVVTGQALTITEGTAQAFTDVVTEPVTGQALTTTLNNDGISIFVGIKEIPTGIGFNANLGSLTTVGHANVPVTGQALTITQGTAQGFTDVVTEDVVGIAMSANLGSVTVTGTADISVTGQAMTMQENSVIIGGDANLTLTGEAMSAALGTAVLDANTLIDLTGFDLTMQEGQATATDSVARPVGIEMTMSLTSVKTIVWTEVNTGTTSIWTEVDTAA